MRLRAPALLLGWGAFLWASSTPAEFGNRFVANKRLPVDLAAADQKLSFRFTCERDLSLAGASVYCVEAVSPPSYLLSLQEDVAGKPSGEALVSCGLIPRSQGWSTVFLNEVPLLSGKTYHLVLEFDAKRGGYHSVGSIGPAHHASFLTTDVLNRLHPDEGTPDPSSNALLWEKNQWKELNQEPVFAIHGRGYKSQGNPYDDPGVRPIYGGGSSKDKSKQVLQAQVLHFRCGFGPQSVVVRLRKQGRPTAPLNFQILKNEHVHHVLSLTFQDKALDAGQAPSDWRWVTIGIGKDPTPKFTLSAECWYIAFQTDAGRPSKNFPGCEDCYLLSDLGNTGGLADAADLTFDSGAHLSRAASSQDGGSPAGWVDEFERDANVVILGHDCESGGPGEELFKPTPVPQPPPLEDLLSGAPTP